MAKHAVAQRFSAVFVLAAIAVLSFGCGGSGQSESSALCRALGAKVIGIDWFTWDNGYTGEEATWAGLLGDGILQADRKSLTTAAIAVRDDRAGFGRVLDAAPPELRPRLERLEALLHDPDAVLAHRDDPSILADIRAMRDATPPELCGWA